MQQGDNNNVERRTMNVEPVSDLEPDSSMSFLDFLEVILKRKWMIFSFTLAAAVISIVYSLMLPNIYTAKALILPSREDKGLASSMLAQFGGLAGVPGGALGGPTLLELYVTMLKSESIKDPIIDRFGLLKFYKKKFRSDAYAVLAAKTAISFNKKDGVITINVSDKNPKWAAELANAYVQELDKMTIRLNVTGEGKNRFFLERRLGEAKADLARAEEALKDFQSKNKVLDMPEQARATIGGVAHLKAQLAMQEVQLATLRQQFADSSREMIYARTSVANLRAQIAQLEGKGGGSIPAVGSVPGLGQEYVRLMREYKTQENIVEILTKQYEMSKINETKDMAPFQVMQPAQVPEKKSGPFRRNIVLIATFTGFFFSVLLAYAREHAESMSEANKARWSRIMDLTGIRIPGRFWIKMRY